MIKFIISNSIILGLVIFLVGALGSLFQNIWLGKLGSQEYKEADIKKKGIIPSIMLFFPLPFTTYTYVFFRALSSRDPRINLGRFKAHRRRIFKFHLKKAEKQ